ncbi:MAG: transcription antitermination protein NusB [Bacteroidales bacterium]|nr:transcription antitermination protein NusB [Bacteroidales bacterium]MDD5910580.1 transcription antitermination protein NusB [Bacteroidales bacterium]
MLNRRILRIKAFKVLYANALTEKMSLAEAEVQLEQSCEATRDLYLFMLGLVSPLTRVAAERIEAAKGKFNPTEEERNPNMKFAENALATLLDNDVDFQKIYAKKKFSWSQYDLLLKKILTKVQSSDYYAEYMASPKRSLAEDCRLFIRIYEQEIDECEEIERLLEEKSINWNDDLGYALTWCCRTFKSLAGGQQWNLPPLYQSDMLAGADVESDKLFVKKLLRSSFANYQKYSGMIADSVQGWEKDRLFSTDVVLIVMGLAEAVSFPEIPLKVTLNEYVEISKFFGTPKSRSFVNGILDNLVQKMVRDGEIIKTGKGVQ